VSHRFEETASREAVRAELSKAIEVLSRVKERLPLLKALAAELDRMAAGRHVIARNELVLQMAHDSHDMLVIDLHSLREHMLSDRGLFKVMAIHCRLLRRFTADDHNEEGIFLGPPEHESIVKDSIRNFMVARWNEVFDRVFPGRRTRVKEKHVEKLRLKFKQETQPTEDDRNMVRAHRYAEHHDPQAVSAAFQSLDRVEAQIKVFERHLRDLLFLATRGGHAMNWPITGDADTTAGDLADLIVHGSINWATIKYGMAPEYGVTVGDEPQWYWAYRKRFFEAGKMVDAAEEDGPTPTLALSDSPE
jgi:hypothetical protein